MAAIEGERVSGEAHDTSMRDRVKVIYLSGTGRSGTTLVGNALGSIPGTVSIGEVRYGIRRGLVDGGYCGCQSLVRDCPVWVPALEATFGRIPTPDEAAALDRRLSEATRTRTTGHWLAGRGDEASQELVDTLGRLTLNVAACAGVDTVVDSSKLPTYGMLLDRHPDLDVRVVHVVRDPRAVAWSWQRSGASEQVAGFEEDMERFSAAKASLMWITAGMGTHAWGKRATSNMHTLRYEDFVADPGGSLREIAQFAAITPDSPDWLKELLEADGLRLGTSHSMAGNPNRVRSGAIALRRDDEWRGALPTTQRRLISFLTFAARRRHGY